tara:strand:+ start:1164 stop:1496 length:333 start_codon:yes stop_codon:yes gene_type:complete
MNDEFNEQLILSKPLAKRSPYGSRLVPKIMQKPIGVGFFVGLSMGITNSMILSIPLLLSVPAGIILGISVCLIASPGMRNDLAQFKQQQREQRKRLLARKGRKNAFTMYE